MKQFLLLIGLCLPMTLQEAYNQAGPFNEYEKYVILEPNQIYSGGIGIFEGDVYIDCKGSIIDLDYQNGIWIYADENYLSSLEMQYCNIINGGYFGVSFSGTSIGKVTNCNFYNNEIGLKAFDNSTVEIENSNFINNVVYGLGIITEDPIVTVNYSNSWNNGNGDYWENCPGWGNIWTPWVPEPGIDLIYENPNFVNLQNLNFNYAPDSPCINAGNPNLFDSDGSIRDIGANVYQEIINGDCNQDLELSILDVVYLINNCILFDLGNCSCSDINQDGESNVLDVVNLVNLILN